MLNCAARLRSGETVSDTEFDAVYPEELRYISCHHWTPVAIACRAAQMLAETGATNVLDVGAGPGKFCIIGALTTPAYYTGIEQRPNLVQVAQVAARRFGADRAIVVRANIASFESRSFNGFYFYNPFREQIADDTLPIDHSLQRSRTLYNLYVAAASASLVRAPAGTAVVTYRGFGGPLPPQYRRVRSEGPAAAEIALWVREGDSKARPRRPSAEHGTAKGRINA